MNRLVVLIISIVLSNAIINCLIWPQPEVTVHKDVPCYDRYSNLIKGETCTENIIGIERPQKIFITVSTGIFSLIYLISGVMLYKFDRRIE